MSRNLKTYMMEDELTTPEEVVANLANQVPGRSIGERYVVSADTVGPTELVIELDDGSTFVFRCSKVN